MQENDKVNTEDSALVNEFDSASFLLESYPEAVNDQITDSVTQVNDKAKETTDSTETYKELENNSDEEYSDWDFESSTNNETTNDVTSNTEETVSTDTSWKTLAEELGYSEIESIEDFKNVLKSQKEAAQNGYINEKIQQFQSWKDLSDENLMREELKAKGYNDVEIEDTIDTLIENNTLKLESRKIRKILDEAIQIEKQSYKTSTNESSMNDEEAEAARVELKNYLSKTDNMFGGKINSKQKDEHFNYIQEGKFFDEITSDAESIASAAWLWRNRETILKAFKSNGFEKGKAKIIDKLVNPETNRTTRIPDPETGAFNPNKFLENNY